MTVTICERFRKIVLASSGDEKRMLQKTLVRRVKQMGGINIYIRNSM